MSKEDLKKNLKSCIELLDIEGKNTKKQVRFLLKELLDELEEEELKDGSEKRF